MPFKSEKQRRFLFAKHPDVARKFAEEEKRHKGFSKIVRRKKAK